MSRFLLIIFLAAAIFVGPASAQSVGIDFKNMPVGTKIYYQSYDGESWVSTFQGRKGKNYIVSVDVKRKGRSYRGTQRYNLDGHQQRWNSGGGFTERWRPHSCNRVIGNCTHKWTNSYGSGNTWILNTSISGNVIKQTSRLKRELDVRERRIQLGKFNLAMRSDWKSKQGEKRWTKIVKIEVP